MTTTTKGGLIATLIGPKKRWRAYRARVRQLPDRYRTTVEAIERYMMHFVPTDGHRDASRFEALADLFEQAAADRTPIRQIVGHHPAEFVDAFVEPYTDGGYVPARARRQLADTITRAADGHTGNEQRTLR